MNTQPKMMKLSQRHAAAVDKATAHLKMRLLLAIGILVLCTVVLEYVVVKLEHSEGAEARKFSLLITALSLPAYFFVLFVREYFYARWQRKNIAKMVTNLSEQISIENLSKKERLASTASAKKGSAKKSAALVTRIVQMINA